MQLFKYLSILKLQYDFFTIFEYNKDLFIFYLRRYKILIHKTIVIVLRNMSII